MRSRRRYHSPNAVGSASGIAPPLARHVPLLRRVPGKSCHEPPGCAETDGGKAHRAGHGGLPSVRFERSPAIWNECHSRSSRSSSSRSLPAPSSTWGRRIACSGTKVRRPIGGTRGSTRTRFWSAAWRSRSSSGCCRSISRRTTRLSRSFFCRVTIPTPVCACSIPSRRTVWTSRVLRFSTAARHFGTSPTSTPVSFSQQTSITWRKRSWPDTPLASCSTA